MSRVDPPDYPAWPTGRRLLSLWWKERRLGIRGLVCAFAYSGVSLAIPVLIQRAIDNGVVHEKTALWPYLVAIVVLAALRAAINFTRRYATARVGIRIEARMRKLLYEAYLVFPRAFYDRHATGQVLSRATNDLYPIRYAIGWGLVQGVQSVLMIIGASAIMIVVSPRLALYTAVSMPLVGIVAWLFAHKVHPISREVQQKKGDVTEAADESVVGIEMVQAFGREDDVRSRFAGKATGVRDTVLRQAGVEARHLPGLFYLPSLSLAVVLFFGGREVIAGQLTYGEFALFTTLLLAARLAARVDGLDHQPRAARSRVGGSQLRLAGGNRDAPRAKQAEEPPARADRRPVRGGSLRLRGRRRDPARDRPRRPTRRGRGRLRRNGLGQDDAPQPAPALLRPDRRGRADRRRRCARPLARRPAQGRRGRDPAADPVLGPAAREPARWQAGRGLGRSSLGVRGGGRRLVRRRPAGWLRHADRRARREPLRRPAPTRGTRPRADRRRRACSCSTIRSRPSTPIPSTSSSAACGRRSRG